MTPSDWAAVVQAGCAVLALFGLVVPWVARRLRPSPRERARKFIELAKKHPRPKKRLLKITKKLRASVVLDAENLDALDHLILNFPDLPDGEKYEFRSGTKTTLGEMALRDFRQDAYFALTEFIEINDF